MSRLCVPAIVLCAAAVAGPVATASAQPVSVLAEVAHRVDVGDRVEVVDSSGVTFAGRLVRVTADDIVLDDRSGRRRTFTASGLQRIDRRGDPLSNGMRLGAQIGGAVGGALGAMFSGEFRAADLLQGIAWFGAAGLLVGLCADAMHVGVTPLYVAPPRGGRGGGGGAGGVAVGAVLRW